MANRLLCSAIFLSLSSSASLGEMSKDVSWRAGSFFATAVRCEEHDQIRREQAKPLMRALNRYLSPQQQEMVSGRICERHESIFGLPGRERTPCHPVPSFFIANKYLSGNDVHRFVDKIMPVKAASGAGENQVALAIRHGRLAATRQQSKTCLRR
jgi:hypothetical protein